MGFPAGTRIPRPGGDSTGMSPAPSQHIGAGQLSWSQDSWVPGQALAAEASP